MEALHILRIFQEAATNALNHSGAGSVRLFIDSVKEGQFGILFSDDGKGFDQDACATVRDSYGLRNMQERAREFGFTIKITSEMHKGTAIGLYSAAPEEGDMAAVTDSQYYE